MTLKTRLPFSKYILWLFCFKDNLMKNSSHWVCQCVVIKTHICSSPLLELLPILILIIHDTCVCSKDPDVGRKKTEIQEIITSCESAQSIKSGESMKIGGRKQVNNVYHTSWLKNVYIWSKCLKELATISFIVSALISLVDFLFLLIF